MFSHLILFIFIFNFKLNCFDACMCSKIDLKGVKFVGLGKEENINPPTLDSKNLHKEEGDKEGRTCIGV